MALVRVIHCAMTVWAAVKACDVAAKLPTEALIARKSCPECGRTPHAVQRGLHKA